jgi:hypothetical protein
MEEKGWLALVPRASGKCERLVMRSGSLRRDGQVRQREMEKIVATFG